MPQRETVKEKQRQIPQPPRPIPLRVVMRGRSSFTHHESGAKRTTGPPDTRRTDSHDLAYERVARIGRPFRLSIFL